MKRALWLLPLLLAVLFPGIARAQAVPGGYTTPVCSSLATPPPSGGFAPLGCDASGNLKVTTTGSLSLNPYAATTGQTPQTFSFSGIAGYNGATVDALLSATSGTTIPLGTTGMLGVTGPGTNGYFPVILPVPVTVGGSLNALQQDGSGFLKINCQTGCSGSTTYPYSGTSSGQTATAASFLGAAGIYNSSAPTLTNTQAAPIQLDASGNLKVNVVGFPGVVPCGTVNTHCANIDVSGNTPVTITSGTTAATQSGTWNIGTVTTLPALPANQSVNEAQIGGVAPNMGTGASSTGTQRVAVSTDSQVSFSSSVQVTPTVQNAAYAAGNVMGGIMTFANAVRATQDSGILESISIVTKSTQTTSFSLCLFTANPGSSTFTDKAAPAIATADDPKLINCYTLAGNTTVLGANATTYALPGIGQQFTSASTSIFGVLVTTAGYTPPTTTDVIVTVGVLED